MYELIKCLADKALQYYCIVIVELPLLEGTNVAYEKSLTIKINHYWKR